MKIKDLVSFYFTGSSNPSLILSKESTLRQLTKQELDDLEMTQKDYEESELKSHRFQNQAFNLNANIDTVDGQFRLAGLSVVGSVSSGIGAGIGSMLNFFSGIGIVLLTLASSFIDKIPFLSTKFSIFSFGGNLIRGSLHVFDSIFSLIGHHSSKYTLPSILAGALSLFSLNRTVNGTDNKSLEACPDTVQGTLRRTTIHHVDAMLASKATQLSEFSPEVGAFVASSLTTSGLLIKDDLKKKQIPWNTMEGFIAQGGSNFVDSLFSNVGNAFSSVLDEHKKIGLGAVGVALGMPVFGRILNKWDFKIPFGTFEGRLIRSALHLPESFAFNIGSNIGNSVLGIPLSVGFAGLTYLTCLSERGKNLLKNFNIEGDTLGAQFQRLPFFHLMYSVISSAGMKLSSYIPAPLLVLFGPALSFKIGERLKNIPAKFNETKGLMLRNMVHLWETILTRAAYRTGRMLTNTHNDEISSGSVLQDGRWLTEDGRIVDSMARGKQGTFDKNKNLLSIFLSGIGGIVFSLGASILGKQFVKQEEIEVPNRDNEQLIPRQSFVREDVEACHGKTNMMDITAMALA